MEQLWASPFSLVVKCVGSEEPKVKGVVKEVGLERDEGQFHSFNLKIGVVVKAGKSLNYEDGEQLMRQFRKELLGKEVNITPITFPCPICGRGFKSEQGMKQHMRIVHEKKTRKKAKKKSSSKKKRKKPKSRKKSSRT